MSQRDPFGGKYHGIWDVEGDSEPVLISPDSAWLTKELARRQGLPVEDDDHLSGYNHVFSCDIVGAWWNSHDVDPREEEPLTLAEIISVQEGDL